MVSKLNRDLSEKDWSLKELSAAYKLSLEFSNGWDGTVQIGKKTIVPTGKLLASIRKSFQNNDSSRISYLRA